MATALPDLVAKLRIDVSGLNNSVNEINQKLAGTAKTADSHFGGIGKSLSSLGNIAKFAIGFQVVDALGQIPKAAITAAGSFEQTRIAFTGVLGSAEKANAFLSQLQKFAAVTPFEFPQLQRAAQQLLAVGFSAQDVIPVMTKIGNAAAALGASGDQINLVVRALGQMKGKGKVSAEEINQIAENLPGFNSYAAIAAKRGTSVAQVMSDMAKGAIPADEGIQAILEGMQNFPGAAGAMERQSKTLIGVISTLKDNLRQVAIDFITPKLPALSAAVQRFGDLVSHAFSGATKAAAVDLAVLLGFEEDSNFEKAIERIGKALKDLGPIVEDIFTSKMGVAKLALTAFVTVLATLLDGVVAIGLTFTDFNKALDRYGIAGTAAAAVTGSLLAGFLALKTANEVAGGINSAVDAIGKLPKASKDAVSELSTLAKRIDSLSDKTVKVAQSGAETAALKVLYLKDSIDALKDKTIQVAVETKDQATDLSKNGSNAAKTFVTGLVSGIAGAIGGAIASSGIGEALAAGVAGAVSLPVLIGALAVVAVGAAAFFAFKFRDQLGKFLTDTVPSALSTAIGAIGTFFSQTVPQALSTGFSALGSFVSTTLPHVLGQAVGFAIAGALVLFIGLPIRAAAEIVKGIPKIVEAVAAIGQAMASGFLAIITTVVPAVAGFVANVVSFFFQLPVKAGEAALGVAGR
jgi:tape measure domain-containing protein